MIAVQAEGITRADRQRCRLHRDSERESWREFLATLDGDEWHRPTVCDAWDVADIVGHLCGQAEDVIRPWSFPVRYRKAKRVYPEVVRLDAHMMVQADAHRGTPPDVLRARFDRLWGKATRMISRSPAAIRRISIPIEGMPGFESIALGYVWDILLARDLWMHRDDVCQALGRPFDAGPYGGELVAQVVLDLVGGPFWGDRPTVVLELTGPGGGVYQLGAGEPVATVRTDAVGYMRTVSGRDDHPVVDLVDGDEAGAEAVATCRMPF